MALVRIIGAGKAVGDKVTASEFNAIDANIEGALDKRSGEADTLESVVTASGAGRLIPTYAAGANADTTYLVSGANALIDVSTLTADRIYTLSNTNAAAGDKIAILNRHATYAITVKNAAATTLIVLGPAGASGHESGWAELWFNGTAWELAKSAAQPASASIEFTSNTTWTVPRGWTMALAIGCGGGGGGGGGGTQAADTNVSSGGGGGGGAREVTVPIVLIPGESINVVIGGGGGTAASAGNGNPGTPSTVTRVTGSVLLATFAGAQGGSRGATDQVDAAGGMDRYVISPGGPDTDDFNGQPADPFFTFDGQTGWALPSQHGGRGMSPGVATSRVGGASPQGKVGGNGGNSGANDGTWRGGGPAGGGGAGPYGNGGNAGSGGVASSAGANVAGTNGAAAGANSGAGGGGGGAAGAGSTSQAGGTGGAGGSGRVRIVPLR